MDLKSYLIDLSGKSLFDQLGSNSSWIQALPLGNYHHPVYGNIAITADRVQRFADNVKNKVRDQDLDIDYDHKAKDGRAAGWIKDAEARSDGLWILVEWTDQAAKALQANEYRYFSPEFQDQWEHPKTKQKFQDVMFGGALTNRPFLKDILPINLSEMFDEKGKILMDPLKEIAKLLSLSEDTADSVIVAKLSEVLSTSASEKATILSEKEAIAVKLSEAESTIAKLKDPQNEDLKKLAETNPLVRVMLEEREENAKRLAALETSNKLSELSLKLSEVDKVGKFAIPPAIKDKFKDLAVSAPQQLSDGILDILAEISKTGLIQLGEVGSNRINPTESYGKMFADKVSGLMKANEKLSYADAVSQVAADNPELFDNYRTEVMTGGDK